MIDPKSVTVTIFGQEYTLRGDAEAEYVQKVAAYVDRKMREVGDNSQLASTAKVAILAAVNIADELFRERQRRHEALAALEERTGRIADLIEREVG
jgi:cell division protein ZapA